MSKPGTYRIVTHIGKNIEIKDVIFEQSEGKGHWGYEEFEGMRTLEDIKNDPDFWPCPNQENDECIAEDCDEKPVGVIFVTYEMEDGVPIGYWCENHLLDNFG